MNHNHIKHAFQYEIFRVISSRDVTWAQINFGDMMFALFPKSRPSEAPKAKESGEVSKDP